MALTAAQRRRLPSSAFVYPKSRKYPVPTKSQARAAGISERDRAKTLRAAKSYAARKDTSGTPSKVGAVVRRRNAGAVKSVAQPATRRRRAKPKPRASRRRLR